jgi:4-amino-4-deoxy-L-arabinose transferase-like glycosyltransferase
LPPPPDSAFVAVPLAIALGLGLLGMMLLLLASLSVLKADVILGCAAILLGASLYSERVQLHTAKARLRAWRPLPTTRFEMVVVGLTVGLVSLAMLSSFVPETLRTASDAVRQHLPIAREIWQTGAIPAFPPMWASAQPIQGHLFYAVAYGFGGAIAAKLFQLLLSLATIGGVIGIGWLCAGRTAAIIGGAMFATVPISLWIFGHAYTDLIATFFVATAALCILLWQRDGKLIWLLVAGGLTGLGFATKLNMAIFAIGLAAGLFLVGRGPWRWRERFIAVLAFGVGAGVTTLPWIMRGLLVTGSFPGLSKARELLAIIRPVSPLYVSEVVDPVAVPLPSGGIGRSIPGLLRSPWDLTFDGAPPRYRVIEHGEFGISWLAFLPLILVRPRMKATSFLAVAAIVSYLGWIFTLQVPRHLLPTLALVSALVGIGAANVIVAPCRSCNAYLPRLLSWVLWRASRQSRCSMCQTRRLNSQFPSSQD